MECNFVVGQKVVMVKQFSQFSLDRARDDGVTLPVIGPVYTVRDMEPGEDWNKGKVYLRLDEIRNEPHIKDGIEPSFGAWQFRAVAERKTDISVFKAMLNPSKVKETANV